MSKLSPERRPWSRAKAKKWFARTHPDYRIDSHDGKETFLVVRKNPERHPIVAARHGRFVFKDIQMMGAR